MKVDIDVLKEHYPDEYQRYYEEWAESQWEFMDETWDSDMRELANEWLKGTGWEVDSVDYRLCCSQGDGVGLDACFTYSLMSEERLNEFRERFPMCAEMMRREMFWVYTVMQRHYPASRISWEADYPGSEYIDISCELLSGGIYDGLPLFTAVQLCEEEGEDNAADFLYQDIVEVERRLYQWMVDDAEHRTSEDAFVEWAREMEETFVNEVYTVA